MCTMLQLYKYLLPVQQVSRNITDNYYQYGIDKAGKVSRQGEPGTEIHEMHIKALIPYFNHTKQKHQS